MLDRVPNDITIITSFGDLLSRLSAEFFYSKLNLGKVCSISPPPLSLSLSMLRPRSQIREAMSTRVSVNLKKMRQSNEKRRGTRRETGRAVESRRRDCRGLLVFRECTLVGVALFVNICSRRRTANAKEQTRGRSEREERRETDGWTDGATVVWQPVRYHLDEEHAPFASARGLRGGVDCLSL